MPVKSKTTDPEHELENVLMRKSHGQLYFSNIRNFLQVQRDEEEPAPQRCSVEMIKKMTVVLQEELGKKQFHDASAIVSAIQHAAGFLDNPNGLPVLLANGVIDLLAYAFDHTEKHVSRSDHSDSNQTADSLMEVILETINDVADYSENAKKEAVGVFTEKLMCFVRKEKKFHVRMEAIRTLNLLLEGCADEITQVIREHPPAQKQMSLMADLLTTAGDFEMQVACTETLARLVKRSDKANYDLIQNWFDDPEFAAGFMKIKDSTFETDCRKFLNNLNESLGSKRSVYSLPCFCANLGSFKLTCPTDANLTDFWVDFNTVSQRITLYVADNAQKENDEGGMWETVAIRQEAVERFRVSERPGDRRVLFITLNVPASEVLFFCPSNEKSTEIHFDAKQEVLDAAVAVFGQNKLSQTKTSVSLINIQVHNEGSSLSPGPGRNIRSADESSDSMSIQNAKIYGLGEESEDTSRQKIPRCKAPPKPKASVPQSLMWTPTKAKMLKAQGSSVSSSTRSISSLASQSARISVKPLNKKSDFAQPKTPVKSNPSATKRVKTPLQIIMSDKAADSGSDSVASYPSVCKKFSVSSGISISSFATPTRLRQKLQQEASKKTPTAVSGSKDAEPDLGSRSDPGRASNKTSRQAATQKNQGTAGQQNGYHDQINGYRSDLGPGLEDHPQEKRQLRSRITKPPPLKTTAKKHQELETDAVEHQEEQGSSGGEKEPKTKKMSRKFRLYYNNGDMMMNSNESGKDVSDTDVVIPSSIPTQENVDTIPDSLPPSGKPPSPSNEPPPDVLPWPQRIQEKSSIKFYPVAHSPLLSTLTEESTHSKSKATIAIGGETATAKSSYQKQYMETLREQVIEEVSSEENSEEEEMKTRGDDGKVSVLKKTKPLPPSKAFRNVPPVTSDSSQELSQFEFTSKVEPPRKRGRPKKNAGKTEKKQPQKGGGKSGKKGTPAEEPTAPRGRSQRAAAKAAKNQIQTQTKTSESSSEESDDPASIKKPYSPAKKTMPVKERVWHYQSPLDVDLSVYDFPETESCPSVSLQPPKRKKRSPKAKAAKDVRARRKVLTKRKPGKKQPTEMHDQSLEELPETMDDDDDTGRRQSRKNTQRHPQSPEELSDIERPRNAAPMTFSPPSRLSPSEAIDEQYCEEDFENFIESFTSRQKSFLERNFPQKPATEAFEELLFERRKSKDTDNNKSMSAKKAQEERAEIVVISPERQLSSSKKPRGSDAASERSWLTNKPKHEVSTYSKAGSKKWVPLRSTVDLDASAKKGPFKKMKRKQRTPPAVQKKKKKTPPTAKRRGSDSDSLGRCLYYYQGDSSGLSDSQPLLPSLDQTQMTTSDAASERGWLTDKSKHKLTTQLASTPDALQDCSIEIIRDADSSLEYEDSFPPLTPIILEGEIRIDPVPDLVTPKILKIASSTSSRCSSFSGKTPKQVTFNSDPAYAEDMTPEVCQEDTALKSGPSSWVRPSSSMLKRKYGDRFKDDDEEDEDHQEDIEYDGVITLEDNEEPSQEMAPASCGGQGALRPKKLFKGAVSGQPFPPEEPPEEDLEETDENSSDAQPSTPQSSCASQQISKMLRSISESFKRKRETKQSQAQQLTEGALRATQRQVSKLFSQQHQARSKSQEEFQSSILEEIVALEEELSKHVQDTHTNLQSILGQHRRKTSLSLQTHIQQVRSVYSEHEAVSSRLNNQLGKNLMQGIRSILAQEMSNMQRQIAKDNQEYELQQVKKGLQSMFGF